MLDTVIITKENKHNFMVAKLFAFMIPLVLSFYSKPDKCRNVSLYAIVFNLIHMKKAYKANKKISVTGTDQCRIPSGTVRRNKV